MGKETIVNKDVLKGYIPQKNMVFKGRHKSDLTKKMISIHPEGEGKESTGYCEIAGINHQSMGKFP